MYKIQFKYRPRYKDSGGNKLVGVTTAINKLAKPALVIWAYNLGKDAAGVKRLRKQYVKQMKQTSYWDAFDLILEQDNLDGTNFRKLASVVAKVSQLEAVMAGYREKVKSGAFFATN